MGRRYPSLVFLGCVIAGIIISDSCRLATWLYFVTAITSFAVAMIFVGRRQVTIAVVACGVCLLSLSAVRFGQHVYEFGPSHISRVVEDGGHYRVFGRIADWPEFGSLYTNVTVETDSLVGTVGRRVTGRLLLRVSDTTTALQRGDRIEFSSRIYKIPDKTGTGGFDYSRFLNLKGVTAIAYLTTLLDVRIDRANRYSLYVIVDNFREVILDSFRRNLSVEASALAAGFLMGETRNIPPEVYGYFRDSGTLHLLAVSGSNVALIVIFFIVLLRPFSLSRRSRSVILLAVIGLFGLLSYGEPSVVRASVMASFVLIVQLLERRYDLNNIVALTAFCILLYAPSQLFDVSFQLSFAAAWGLIFILPRIHRRFPRYHGRLWYRWLVLPVMVATVAQLSAAPLIAFYFQRTPLISPIANLVIVPLVSAGVLGVLILLVADFIWPLLGLFVGSLLTLLTRLVVTLLAWFGGEGTPVIQSVGIAPAAVFAAYLILIVAAASLTSRQWRRWLVFGMLGLLNLFLLREMLDTRDGDSSYQSSSFRVPGGIATVLRSRGADVGDLVLVGLRAKEYDLCEKVLVPDVRQFGISRLRHLIVVEADQAAIDDIRRTALELEAARILVHPDLIRRFADWERVDTMGIRLAEPIGPSGGGSESTSLFSNGESVVLRWTDGCLVFQRCFKPLTDFSTNFPVIYVISEPWYGSMDELLRLTARGDRFVCSRIAQREEDYDFPEAVAFPIAGNPVVDLSLVGRFELELSKTPRNSR